MNTNRVSKIFQPKMIKVAKAASTYLWKYLRKKPLVFNLNLNVTNICNQNCPMCNAVIVGKAGGVELTIEKYKEIINRLETHKIASLTLSGGEPSLVKDIAQILDYSAGKFPFGVNVNSNLYASEKIIRPFAEAALRNNIRIGTSFDGIGDVADTLRGAKNTSKRVLENVEMVTEMRKEMGSTSTLNFNTVISDQNLDQIPEILALSEKYGWTHTLAPWNIFFYQSEEENTAQTLKYSKKLEEVIELALTKDHVATSRDFLSQIPSYVQGKTDKYCPYLTSVFKTYKIFMEPNGDLSLCSREPIGNIFNSSLEGILNSQNYVEDCKQYKKCPRCWMACFVEVLLAMPKFYQKRIINRYK